MVNELHFEINLNFINTVKGCTAQLELIHKLVVSYTHRQYGLTVLGRYDN